METQDFVAIDFETMTPELTSACAIGLVRVHNGVISQKYYSLIKPIPDFRTERNTHVHGLTDEMVADAPPSPNYSLYLNPSSKIFLLYAITAPQTSTFSKSAWDTMD